MGDDALTGEVGNGYGPPVGPGAGDFYGELRARDEGTQCQAGRTGENKTMEFHVGDYSALARGVLRRENRDAVRPEMGEELLDRPRANGIIMRGGVGPSGGRRSG